MQTATGCKQHAPKSSDVVWHCCPSCLHRSKHAILRDSCDLACTSQATEQRMGRHSIATDNTPIPLDTDPVALPCVCRPRLQHLAPASLDSAGIVCQPGGGGSQ